MFGRHVDPADLVTRDARGSTMSRPTDTSVSVVPTIEDIAARSQAQLDRLTPRQAFRAMRADSILVDIRQEHFRRQDGDIPGALVLERNVLEWRLDPRSEFRLPEAVDPVRRVILICPHGSVSSIAAVGLRSVGLRTATDVIGGFVAWREAQLPVVPLCTPTGMFVEFDHPEFSVDSTRQQITVDGKVIVLSRLEFIALAELLCASGRVVTKEELRAAVGDWEGSRSRSIDSLIHRLRGKLGVRIGSMITTVRGVGFRLQPTVSGGQPAWSGPAHVSARRSNQVAEVDISRM